jgi:hypothetical protein
MQREGADPENMTAEDFVCDFCHQHWTEERPMVEGHRGSLICGPCLSAAFTELVIINGGVIATDPRSCALCLMHKSEEKHWQSDAVEGWPLACRWCVEKSALMLEKDPETDWARPAPRTIPQHP